MNGVNGNLNLAEWLDLHKREDRSMGCDIHLIVEAREKGKTDRWIGLGNLSFLPNFSTGPWQRQEVLRRNYDFFAKIAGVRGSSDIGLEPLGLPDDASDLSKHFHERWGDDGHSWTYMDFDTFMNYYMITTYTAESAAKKLTSGYLEFVEEKFPNLGNLDMGDEYDYRFIIWFDN